MPRTFLQLVQQAIGELGSLQVPSVVVSSTDVQVQQILALAQREGADFSSLGTPDVGWPQLRQEYVFTLTANQDTYPFPADFDSITAQTEWDRSNRWELLGPMTPQEWQVLKSGITPTGPRRRFRIIGSNMVLDPAPVAADAGKTMVFEYTSKNWCQSAGGVKQSMWTADTDTYLLDEDCFMLGLKWRWLRAKGLDYSQEKADYDRNVAQQIARAGGNRTLSLGLHPRQSVLLGWQNIPDTNYGQGA